MAGLTIVGQVILVLSILFYFYRKDKIVYLANKYGYTMAFLISLVSVVGSLYFSEVALWEPCTLCWFQRIAMYPIVVILAIGIWKQDMAAKTYSIVLAVFGLIISFYQIYLQVASSLGNSLGAFCGVIGAADCSEIYMLEFGYITFPVISATAFLIIIAVLSIKRE